jgi:hypothetical protein
MADALLNSKPNNPYKTMKPKYRSSPLAALAVLVLSPPSSLQAQTWDASFSRLWSDNDNWSSPPAFNNTTDLLFSPNAPAGMVTNGNSMILGNNLTARSLTFANDVDGPMLLTLQVSGGGAARSLTLDTDAVAGNATLSVAAGSTGDVTIGNAGFSGTPGFVVLADNLVVDHNGSGLLLFNRGFSAAAFGITKNGTGSMQTNSFNTLTGPLNINSGTFIANTFGSGGEDLDSFSAINLAGGTLQIGASSGVAKTYDTAPLNVNSPSTLEYKNANTTTYNAAFTVAALVLNADLAVNNTSTVTSVTNAFSLNRPVTGTGKITSTTYNNIASSADNFALGRVSLGGNNASWNGGITIAKGTFLLGGNAVNSAGTGAINIGTTGDAFGAGLTFFHSGPNGSTITYPNSITVNTGGFRAIKGGGTNHSVTFSGPVTLNGDLTLDHTWSTTDRRITMSGAISGNGGLTITRAGGDTGTSVVLTGTNTYLGNTTVASGASLSLSSTCSLTSNITVQNGARIGGAGATTGSLTLQSGAKFFFFYSAGFAPMNVSGAVTLDNSFDVLSGLIGGSQGEAIIWANVAPGTYTLISGTSSTFSNITNFGTANAVTVDTGKTAYFQNGGGVSGGGLQLVVTGPSGFDSWKTTNTTSGGLDDDHDDDGVPNGVEYYLAGNTITTGFNALPGVVDTAGFRSVTWPAASISSGYGGVYGIHFTVETSDTLDAGSWVTAPLGSGAGAVSIPFATATQVRNVKYTFPNTDSKKFARLKITGP